MSLKKFLFNDLTRSDLKELNRISHLASCYILIGGVLYKKTFLQPLLRCLGHVKAEYVMQEAHEGICHILNG
ncbi:hypothetical protein ES332_D11G258000v1 [Gossypium tomentosum]|uniref:Uncharacterized protein n=1 Tax=Gossypium tomentosum TaxID=34277 RepID=A0A5D2IRT0_GOSTO|nr:hypothetical protein ES332_D11G258000v1 [Gossypium tomentosum]